MRRIARVLALSLAGTVPFFSNLIFSTAGTAWAETASPGFATQPQSHTPQAVGVDFSSPPASYTSLPHQAGAYDSGDYPTLNPTSLPPAGYAAESTSSRPLWLPQTGRDPWKYINLELGVTGLCREVPDSQILAFDQNFNQILNADELRSDMQFGFRAFVDILHVSRYLGGTDLQFGYFGINSLDVQRSLSAASVSPVFFNSIPVTPLPTSTIIYSSNLYSGEANLRFLSFSRIRPIAGLRYLKLEDTYDQFNATAGGRVGGFSLTNNSLFGGQFGGEATLFHLGYFEFFANGKLGLMHNRVEGSATAADATGTGVTKNFSDTQFTTLLDVQAGTAYALTDVISLKVAYQVLFADEVALGIDQNSSVRLLSPGEDVSFNSQQWHGLNLAAEFCF